VTKNQDTHDTEGERLARSIERLAAERTAIFIKDRTDAGPSEESKARLKAIETELDECYNALRHERAVHTALRFDREGVLLRGTSRVRTPPPPTRD
jgi:hypothetical protein